MTDQARIVDVGYRRYDGPRAPASRAVLDLAWHGVQRVLGLKRPARHKVLPVAITLMAFVPAVVFVGMAAFLPVDLLTDEILPSYGDYFGYVSMALVLFASFVAPEALCTDRRTGMLGLYLAAPLTRDRYLVGRVGGVLAVVGFLALGPQLLMLVAYTFEGAGPGGVVEVVTDVGRILAAGLVVGLVLTSVAMAVASTTSRRGVASAMIVLFVLATSITVSTAVFDGGAPAEWSLLDVLGVALAVGRRIHGEPPADSEGIEVLGLPLTLAAAVAWIIVGLTVCRVRYQRLAVRQ